jgi:hypothetical protein
MTGMMAGYVPACKWLLKDDNITGDGSEPSTNGEVDAVNWQPPDAYWYHSKVSNVELDAY